MFKSKLLGKILIGIGLVAALSACETTQNGGNRRKVQLDDSVVTAKVKEALAKDPTLQKYDIQVQTVSGKVVLRGRVDSINDVYRAAEVVNRVEGVQFLLNDLSEK
ncbi:BON domain-containing protein [Geotalea sp. SG265]|uniref:BON domain-containing protein n=1 Tax=Geotalea sp. SG265 TaxID=2922867 RepID=UPI001FAEC15A|nr:BON domain-containing protein [Geotalea sp. SG265]